MGNFVNTMEWMLTHPGIAVAKVGKSNNYIEILRYTENIEEFKELADFAKANDYTIVHGVNGKENRLGYLPSII